MKKAFFNGTILLIIIALIGALVIAINPSIFLAPASLACSDTDGGINLTLAGTTCDVAGCAQDYCVSGSKLAEYSCSSANRKVLSTHTCALGCLNARCRFEANRYNLYTASTQLYLNDSINKVRDTVTQSIFPNLFATASFNNGTAYYTSMLQIGKPQITFSKVSNKDPKVGIYASKNYLYNVSIIFSNNINFTDPNSINQNISLLTRNFVVDNETNATRLVLRDDMKYILEDKKPIRFKQINPVNSTETVMRDTLVNLYNNVQDINRIIIQVFPSNEKTISEGSYLIDPFFGTFKVDFNAVSIPENSLQRETFSINPSGNDKIALTMKDHRNLEQTFNWLMSDGLGILELRGPSMNKIHLIESGSRINVSDYFIVGNGTKGYALKLLNLTNQTGWIYDSAAFQDLFSGQIYNLMPFGEGRGELIVNGFNYTVYYTNSTSTAYIRVKYSDHPLGSVLVYPSIETSKGAKIMFYEPLNLSSLDRFDRDLFEVPVSSFRIFNGNNYEIIPVVLNSTSFMVGNQTINSNSSAVINSGKMTYEFVYTGPNATKIFLRDSYGQRITKPAIIVFEKNGYLSNYEALIVKTEGMGSAIDKVGVQDVEMTWGNNAIFKNLQLNSNPLLYKSMDIWGSIITLNKSNTDQYSASIRYTPEQLWNSVYVAEII